jgi:hypothetical protein
LPQLPETESHLRDALRQMLNHPGSMVRAQMAFEIATHYALPEGHAQNLAIAIGYFHTASLILTTQSFSLRSGQRDQPLAWRVYVNAERFFQYR